MRRKSVITLANEKVPFPQAAQWAGIDVWDDVSPERGAKVYCPFGEVEHPDGGLEPAMRVYQDHGWCFAEDRYFTVTSLLAEVWQVSRAEAAAGALQRIGYIPPSYDELYDAAVRDPEPDEGALATALITWCAGQRDDWSTVQYVPAVARMLSRCLGLLPLVHDEADCQVWLDASKQAMQRVLP